MQQTTSKLLYEYWNEVRGNRTAPRRFEIEPAKIASLLPETFIIECGGLLAYRFRLAGTRICEQFGRELRAIDFLELWSDRDREALVGLLDLVINRAAVGVVHFDGYAQDNRHVGFEMTLLPLVHTGATVNRVMGSISALESPYWLGAVTLERNKIVSLDSWFPGAEAQERAPALAPVVPLPSRDPRRRFKVFRGGLSERTE